MCKKKKEKKRSSLKPESTAFKNPVFSENDKGSNCVDVPLCCVSVRRVENKNQHTTTTLAEIHEYK